MYWASSSLHRLSVDGLCSHVPLAAGQPFVYAIEGVAAGSAYGFKADAMTAALAEYAERRHLAHAVPRCGVRRLVEFPHLPSLAEAYGQVAAAEATPVSADTLLEATWVLRLNDWNPVLAPRNLVAMDGPAPSSEERPGLNPVRDSSGGAAHGTAAAALAAALLEFIERQTWLAFWLGGARARPIEAPTYPGIECLLLDAGLPGYVVAAFHSDAAGQGGFGCGVAAGVDAEPALAKASAEADHCSRFAGERRAAAQRKGSGMGRMERNAARFEVPRAREAIPRATGEPVNRAALAALPQLSVSAMRARLAAVSSEVFVYLGMEQGVLGDFNVAKVFSPAFYLHADPGLPLNLANGFSRWRGVERPASERLVSTCLP